MLILAVIVLMGLAVFLVERYDLFDGKTWRSASEPKIAYAYALLFVAVAIAGAALFFHASATQP
jgi:hypothetical protein